MTEPGVSEAIWSDLSPRSKSLCPVLKSSRSCSMRRRGSRAAKCRADPKERSRTRVAQDQYKAGNVNSEAEPRATLRLRDSAEGGERQRADRSPLEVGATP